MNNTEIQPLNKIAHLDDDIRVLPNINLQNLINDPQLISGYIKQSQEFIEYVESIVTRLDEDSSKLLQVQALIGQYQTISQTISQQLAQILDIYQQFNNLQTIQYQLLLIFNQDYLLKKFEKQLQTKSEESLREIDYSDPDLKYISQFRQSRKQYHFQREKLNRWKEERVTGFI